MRLFWAKAAWESMLPLRMARLLLLRGLPDLFVVRLQPPSLPPSLLADFLLGRGLVCILKIDG